MTKICDHTSVGMFVWKDEKLLLIERAKFPFGFSVPAGHVDGDSTFEESAKRELKEEVGLDAVSLELIGEGRKENVCRREGGSWHYWKMYKIETTGDINVDRDESKQGGWYSLDQIRELAKRTELYNSGKISEDEWLENPGILPGMYEWLKELKIV